jgi:hypothetical protein
MSNHSTEELQSINFKDEPSQAIFDAESKYNFRRVATKHIVGKSCIVQHG